MSAHARGAPNAAPLLVLSLECNNRCIFCGQSGLPPRETLDFEAELAKACSASRGVTFAGGEPTLDPFLVDKVGRAHEVGLSPIVVQTNGTRLDEARARELAERGLTAVHLSIHGSEPHVHDYHSGNPGSFARVVGALDAARSAGLRVYVTTVVTRSNFRVLSPLAALVARKGAAAWRLAFPDIAGRAAQATDRVVPRFGLAVPYALQALEAAGRAKLPTFVSGVPACLLGPFAGRALPEAPRAFAAACSNCEAQKTCAGVDAEYLARFDGDELAKATWIRRDRMVFDHAPFFAGPGELAPRAERPERRESNPRRALPILGKVRPAIAEAAPNTARRSGEALREIFPGLFATETPGRPPSSK
jgi:Radical SAM superfamily